MKYPVRMMSNLSALFTFSLLLTSFCTAQMTGSGPAPGGPARPGGFQGMPRVAGTVTVVHGSDVSIQTDAGVAITVHCSDNTRIYKDRAPAKLTDIHVGDMLMAAGAADDKTHILRAVFVADINAAEVQKMHADLGKTWIAGKVTHIDTAALKLTIQRIDQKTQVIAVDDTTSFEKSGQNVTLRDVHVGSMVRGKGSLKNGVFVPQVMQILDGKHAAGRPKPLNGPPSGAPPLSSEPPQH